MRKIVVVALNSHLIPDLDPLPAGAWRALRNVPESDLSEFVRLRLPGSDRQRVEERLSRIAEFEEELDRLSAAGILVLTEFDEAYPRIWDQKLGDRRPSHLYVAGNPDLLNQSAIGVVGSRNVSGSGVEFSREVAQVIAISGKNLVSGGARGVDAIAMRAAFDAGGSSIGLLADSLTKKMKEWDLESGRVCLATPFAPNAGFQVGNAMARNKLIYALSDATVVVAADLEEGGTWTGACEAIKANLCPILVRETEGAGNVGLIGRGGVPLADPKGLLACIEKSAPTQQRLL